MFAVSLRISGRLGWTHPDIARFLTGVGLEALDASRGLAQTRSRVISTPKMNPPTWVKNATPPPLALALNNPRLPRSAGTETATAMVTSVNQLLDALALARCSG